VKVYLTTDTHFFHKKMHEYQARPIGFEEKILKGLKQIPRPAILIHLGDLCIGRDKEALKLFHSATHQLNTILVRGNHDKKSIQYYLEGFDAVVDTMTLNIFGKKILFSHEPQPDGDYDLNIHGHCHSPTRTLEFKPTMHEKQKLITLELTHYQPVSLESFLSKDDKKSRFAIWLNKKGVQ
jgi:calcineurin-like phosphoesterase family protein